MLDFSILKVAFILLNEYCLVYWGQGDQVPLFTFAKVSAFVKPSSRNLLIIKIIFHNDVKQIHWEWKKKEIQTFLH